MEFAANVLLRMFSGVLVVLAMLGTFAIASQFDWLQDAVSTLSEAVYEGRDIPIDPDSITNCQQKADSC